MTETAPPFVRLDDLHSPEAVLTEARRLARLLTTDNWSRPPATAGEALARLITVLDEKLQEEGAVLPSDWSDAVPAPSELLDVVLANGLTLDHADHRDPYVGDGADGARRSAQVDREEADCLDSGTPRYDLLLASAAAWDRQADELDADR